MFDQSLLICTPSQDILEDGNDSGILMCQYAKLLSGRHQISHINLDIEKKRQEMAKEIRDFKIFEDICTAERTPPASQMVTIEPLSVDLERRELFF